MYDAWKNKRNKKPEYKEYQINNAVCSKWGLNENDKRPNPNDNVYQAAKNFEQNDYKNDESINPPCEIQVLQWNKKKSKQEKLQKAASSGGKKR